MVGDITVPVRGMFLTHPHFSTVSQNNYPETMGKFYIVSAQVAFAAPAVIFTDEWPKLTDQCTMGLQDRMGFRQAMAR